MKFLFGKVILFDFPLKVKKILFRKLLLNIENLFVYFKDQLVVSDFEFADFIKFILFVMNEFNKVFLLKLLLVLGIYL